MAHGDVLYAQATLAACPLRISISVGLVRCIAFATIGSDQTAHQRRAPPARRAGRRVSRRAASATAGHAAGCTASVSGSQLGDDAERGGFGGKGIEDGRRGAT